MNLPVLAMDFLDVFEGFLSKQGRLKELPVIHVYGFVKGENEEEQRAAVEERIRPILKGFRKEHIRELKVVKNVTAKKLMVCCSFQLDRESATLPENYILRQAGGKQAGGKDEEVLEGVNKKVKKQ